MYYAHRFVAIGLMAVLAMAGLGVTDANAQQIFRFVGPDGRVTFSDKPPLEASAKATAVPTARSGSASNIGTLPFELREAASRYPVTLYTAPGCGTCDSGRALLSNRGVPFTEKTVTNNEDIQALQRISGGSSVPLVSIGGQQIRGYSELEWTQFLDAAGYPKTSQLPASFSQAPATPLVTAETPAIRPSAAGRAQDSAQAASTAEGAPESGAPPEATEENPAGIRF